MRLSGRARRNPPPGRTVARVLHALDTLGTRRDGLFAGGEPIGRRHRQGQRHHQLPFVYRSHRTTRHGTVLAHRPAQCHGWARGRRSGEHARGAFRHQQSEPSRIGSGLLEQSWHRGASGPEGRRSLSRRGRGTGQGDLDHGHQPGRFPAGRGCRAGCSSDVSVRGRERRHPDRHDTPCACPPAGGRLGREERHGDEFRAPHLAPALLSESSGRGAARLAHRLRCGRPHGLCRGLRLSVAGRDLP